MRGRLFRLTEALLRRFKFFLVPVKKAYIKHQELIQKQNYNSWANNNEQNCFAPNLEETKLVSIVVPAFNTDPIHAREMVYSVINQHYQNWELVIVNASTDSHRKVMIKQLSEVDTRIRIIESKNHGIAGNTNIALQETRGEFIAFLDHDDILHPCALHCVVACIQHENAELIYTDEDKITHDAKYYFDPFCKPGWSPHLLENVNYINHLTVVKKEFVDKVGGLRSECDGAQDFDLLLRIIDECKPRICHVSRVLYHWRAAQTSTARDITTKNYIFKAGERALTDHFSRQSSTGQAKAIIGKPGFYETIYPKPRKIAVLIGQVEPNLRPNCAKWLKKLLKTLDEVHFIVGDWFKPYLHSEIKADITWVNDDETNYLNEATDAIDKSAIVVYFQQALRPVTKDAVFKLAEVAAGSGCYAVQPTIISKDGTILDAGFIESEYGLQPLFKGLVNGKNTYYGNTDWARDITIPTSSVFSLSQTNLKKLVSRKTDVTRISSLDFPRGESYLLWPHAQFEYISFLETNHLTNNQLMNNQLASTSYKIFLESSLWDGVEGKEDE